MDKAKISSTIVFPKLRNILEEDIESLENMSLNKDDKMNELLISLIDTKKQILGVFSENPEGLGQTVSPPQRLKVSGYKSSEVIDSANLISALYKIEMDQTEFVRNSISDKGMPSEMNDKLEDILKIYSKVTEQLGRSERTNQYNAIVI